MNQPNPNIPNSNVADDNIQKLLTQAYRPQQPGTDFARIALAMMQAAAKEEGETRRVGEGEMGRKDAGCSPSSALASPRLRVFPSPRLLSTATVGAAAVVLFALGIWIGYFSNDKPPRTITQTNTVGKEVPAGQPVRGSDIFGMTPQARPQGLKAQVAAVGTTIQTADHERKRIMLADGSVVFVNGGSKLAVSGPREIDLSAGEVFVEVAPRVDNGQRVTFTVKTPTRQVLALGTKFAVDVAADKTNVLVTQGQVQVAGYGGTVDAGRQLSCGREGQAVESAAPRASHELGWVQDLIDDLDALVPQSQYGGGALVAVDPNGQEVKLSLRKYDVDVVVEDGFARTTIDQTYFNHEHARMEGTFYFPLPPDASISRLAMYVNGQLMEGGMAERDYARQVFEEIMYTRRDPALLEWVDGGTFKMRVFPLEGRQEKRIIISYVQKLDGLYDDVSYRFPAGHNMQVTDSFAFHARIKDGAALPWLSDSHSLKATADGNDLLLDYSAKNVKVDQDVKLRLKDGSALAAGEARFYRSYHEGKKYLMLRYRPELAAVLQRQTRDWVVLFESGADRNPLLARAQIEVMRSLLNNAEHSDRFWLVTAGT